MLQQFNVGYRDRALLSRLTSWARHRGSHRELGAIATRHGWKVLVNLSGVITLRALCWHGKEDIRCETVPDPKIQDGRDAIIKVTRCAICGSDLHLVGGFVPNMKPGDVMGHETLGEVVEVRRDNRKLKVGDRVVVPFTISCGECRMCKAGHFSCCERSNPAGAEQAKQTGYPTAGLFGYSHTYGGFPGGQAQYLRVPYADVGPEAYKTFRDKKDGCIKVVMRPNG